MKAITVRHPWASLIACEAKKYETRSWKTNYRGKIAIHAGTKIIPPHEIHKVWKGILGVMGKPLTEWKEPPLFADENALLHHRQFPLGAIIATAELVNCWRIVYHPGVDIDVAKNIQIGAELEGLDKHCPDFARYIVPTQQEMLFGDWTPGRYAWELANVQVLETPIPCGGKQGLWNWEGIHDE